MLVTSDWVGEPCSLCRRRWCGVSSRGEERWERELWEVSADAELRGQEVPKFYFFFGRRDHWVSDRFRAEFIERREGHGEGRTRIEIDEGNLRHAFCVRHDESVVVAGRVSGWIEEIVAGLVGR